MESIAIIPTVTVTNALKDKWEGHMLNVRARTFKLVFYGRQHVMREDVKKAVYEHAEKTEIESLYTTVNPKSILLFVNL